MRSSYEFKAVTIISCGSFFMPVRIYRKFTNTPLTNVEKYGIIWTQTKRTYVRYKMKEEKKMTRFERDLNRVLNGEDIIVLKERKAELDNLNKTLKSCKNSFRAQCIMSDITRLTKEYDMISEQF